MDRRRFIVKSGALAAAGATVAVNAPNVIAQPKYQWRLATSFPPRLPPLHDGAEMFAKIVETSTGGRLKIQVFGAGELMPGLENFDAARQGTIEAGYGAAYYWAGKEPATQWFTAVPFGLNAQGTQAWIVSGGGQKVYDEVYAAFNLVPRQFGATGVQMAGWFRKKIDSIDDYKGLKMRIPGLGGKVVAKAGGTVVLLAAGDIFTSLERGVIDATEWVGPYQDERLGLYKAAKFYYYPGWHEPGTTGELFFNQKAYSSLPVDFQRVIDAAAAQAGAWTFMEHEARNAVALQELVSKHNVQVYKLPDPVLAALRKLSDEVIREEAAKTPAAVKVAASHDKFKKQWLSWSNLSERAYYNMMFT